MNWRRTATISCRNSKESQPISHQWLGYSRCLLVKGVCTTSFVMFECRCMPITLTVFSLHITAYAKIFVLAFFERQIQTWLYVYHNRGIIRVKCVFVWQTRSKPKYTELHDICICAAKKKWILFESIAKWKKIIVPDSLACILMQRLLMQIFCRLQNVFIYSVHV